MKEIWRYQYIIAAKKLDNVDCTQKSHILLQNKEHITKNNIHTNHYNPYLQPITTHDINSTSQNTLYDSGYFDKAFENIKDYYNTDIEKHNPDISNSTNTLFNIKSILLGLVIGCILSPLIIKLYTTKSTNNIDIPTIHQHKPIIDDTSSSFTTPLRTRSKAKILLKSLKSNNKR